MKVIVRCANNRVTKADMEREVERLFQENKDLRVQVGHLRDELAKSESESSQGMNAMVKFWEEAVTEKNKAEERAEEYRIALMESDCRVDELEKQLAWVREEVARLTTERDTAVNENTVMTFDFNELREKWEVERNLRTKAERQVEELRTEVDTCHHNIDGYIEGNRRMRAEYEKKLETEQEQTKHWRKKYDNLKENYDELVQLHREWGEEIDRLRKVVIELQTNRFTTDEFIGMLVKNFMPSADK